MDIGGTFTDFVAVDDAQARVATLKTLTTPPDPTIAVLSGLEDIVLRMSAKMNDVSVIVHGTTLATNAIVERRGAPTALLTTRGFRDVLEMARERRYDIYDLLFRVSEPLVPRHRCWEATERLGKDGEVVVPLDVELLLSEMEGHLKADPIAALGICFLHAHRNPEHERVAVDAIAQRWPDLFISASSDIAPEIGEYERASTVIVNAYIQPVVKAYLQKLVLELERKGLSGRLFVMLSNGGLTTADIAEKRPIGIIESGPVGGVQAACAVARTLERRNVIAFDMGGTTAKICLVNDGNPSTTNDFEVGRVDWSKPGSGLPVKAPFIEMIEIGTGGGSIAAMNSLGLLAVGPLSAGAYPGPACYGLGGELPTVTDADLVLGFLRADGFAGGAFTLNEQQARSAIDRHVAKPLGVTVDEAAWAIHEVANENMANAARLHAAQRGSDIGSFALFASGGAGPVHAAGLAFKLGVNEIIFPFAAGVVSALGFLLSPVSFELSRSLPQSIEDVDCARVNALLEQMEQESREVVCGAGIRAAEVSFDYKCSMSYKGQGFSIEVICPHNRLSPENISLLKAAFERKYRELYSVLIPELEVWASTWRVVASAPQPEAHSFANAPETGPLETARRPSRRAFDPSTGARREFRVFGRESLPAEARFAGPAIIEAPESTIVLGEGMDVYVDRSGNLIAHRRDLIESVPSFSNRARGTA